MMKYQIATVACILFGSFAAPALAQSGSASAPTPPIRPPSQTQPSTSGTPAALDSPESTKPAKPTLLLVKQEVHPRVEISWIAKGKPYEFSETMEYTAPFGGAVVGKNVKGYITMGGSRLETGAGHPKGAIVRLGITKIETNRAFFANIDPHTQIEFAVFGVQFNQPVKYHLGTGMMHLKYGLDDLKACSLPGTARNQYLLSDPNDTLGGRVKPGINATPGALDGAKGHGEFIIEIDPDDPTKINMRIRVPYAQLRHLQDPWKSELPGTFFEPIHLHAEAEFIPIDADPLVRAPIIPEVNESVEAAKAKAAEQPADQAEDPSKDQSNE